jgi:cytochrome c553
MSNPAIVVAVIRVVISWQNAQSVVAVFPAAPPVGRVRSTAHSLQEVHMKVAISLVTAMFVLFVGASAPAFAQDAAAGKEMFTKKCKTCHGDDGAGSAAMQKKYGDKWKALGSADVQGMKDDALAKAVKDNTAHKAIMGSTTDADLADIAAHIRTLKK